MPWYTNPAITCKVLDRIARHHEQTALQDLKSLLEQVAGLIWEKQRHFYESSQH